jgi:type I restriction enzyme, S subunit
MTDTLHLLEKHFDTAFAAPDGVKKLRELILTLAMQGKLVPQDPNDEPASELLKKIEAEKQRSIQDGKLKKAKPLPEIKPEEIPYDLPEGWKWVKLGKLTNIIMGQSPDSKTYNEIGDGLPFFQGKSEYGLIYPTPRKWCSSPVKIAPINSILISVRAPVGPTNICNVNACIGRGLSAIECIETNYFFLLHYFRCFEKHIASFGTGSTFTAITLKVLENLLVPLPPLAEQKRIVEKIDRLMALCDQLEQHLEAATHQQTRLLQAVMAQV